MNPLHHASSGKTGRKEGNEILKEITGKLEIFNGGSSNAKLDKAVGMSHRKLKGSSPKIMPQKRI